MATLINLDNLHSMTNNDAGLEAELFGLFLTSSQKCLQALHTSKSTGDDKMWEQEAHALKGICFNLGAESLGIICKQAQESSRASVDEKEKLLVHMEEELKQVHSLLTVSLASRHQV